MVMIEIIEGDISGVAADALVNAANNYLWMGAGVAGALKRTGGQEIEEEAVRQGPIPVGSAVATGAGRLRAKYVIHAAVMGQDLRTDAGKIRQATRNSLLKADELGLKSIAFPALGTGVGGFSPAECARVMLGVMRDYQTGKTCLEKIIFVLYGQPVYAAFKDEFARQIG
ncbi:MAG: macro domain-containing protein [Dehalococcoidales bacterium]|nr:macro domain-containing protein [Dehalococcoidales bacterium]